MKIWDHTDNKLSELGRRMSRHAISLIGLALTGAPFLFALVLAWFGFALFAVLGLDLLGFLAAFAVLAFLWRYVYVPAVAPAVANAVGMLKARSRATLYR